MSVAMQRRRFKVLFMMTGVFKGAGGGGVEAHGARAHSIDSNLLNYLVSTARLPQPPIHLPVAPARSTATPPPQALTCQQPS